MNKLKIGDKVQLTAKSHSWHTNYIIDVFQIGNRFEKRNFEEIAMLLLSKSRRVKLKGHVLGYGSNDKNFKNKRNYVFVEFYYKDMICDFYCSEGDLKKI